MRPSRDLGTDINAIVVDSIPHPKNAFHRQKIKTARMVHFAGARPFLMAFITYLISIAPQAAADEELKTVTPSAMPSISTRAPTTVPSISTSVPSISPTTLPKPVDENAPENNNNEEDPFDDMYDDEVENPVVQIDLQVAGATEEQIEAVAGLVQFIAGMSFPGANRSDINVTVEWRGTVVEMDSSQTPLPRRLRSVGEVRALPSSRRETSGKDNENKRCKLSVGDSVNVTTITIHGLHGETYVRQIESFLALISSGIIPVVILDHIPVFKFVCDSEVRMSNEAPSLRFQPMDVQETEKTGKDKTNVTAIVIPVVFGIALVGAVGFLLLRKFSNRA